MSYIKEIVRVKLEFLISANERFKVTSTDSAIEFATSIIGDEAREIVFLIIMDAKNHVNCYQKIFIGDATKSTCSVREILKAVLLANGTRFILAHNHPSQDLTPSKSDIQTTKKLKTASEQVGLNFLDHLIVSATEGVSLLQLELF
ncbi:JAB domain-containing protein [Carnobacterium maltaromaticum]|uniref:JAB domain-containing protein n=1 Tax=Carnobacterium maltaromaticum TaxID=2751 RepID=UPI00295ECDA2|nr:JAB domain-containing protein [Carnobacterium maltaromaticum]